MNDRYAKYGAVTGILFVLFIVVGFLVVTPKPPDVSASADEWHSYFTDETGGIRAGVVLVSISLFFFIWFLGSVSSALRVIEGSPRLPTVAFGGGIIAVASLFLIATMISTAAFRPEDTSPELTRALNDVGLMAAVPGIAGICALLGATALVILRSDALPGWLGWLAALAAVAQPLGFGALFTDSGAFAADGELALFLPFILGLATLVALSWQLVVLARDAERGGPGLRGRITGAVTGAAEGAQGKR